MNARTTGMGGMARSEGVAMSGRILAARMTLVVLALLGLFDAALLARERAAQLAAQICLFETACEQLRMGKWSTVPPGAGVPVPTLGLLGFGALLVLAGIGLFRERIGPLPLAPILLLAASLGVAFTGYLIAVQISNVGTICPRCLPGALLTLGGWVAALVGMRGHPAGAPPIPVAAEWQGQPGS